MSPLAQTNAPQLPDLPAGPSLDRVRGPVEIPLFEVWQIVLIAIVGTTVLLLLVRLLIRLIRCKKGNSLRLTPARAAHGLLDKAASEPANKDFAISTTDALRHYFGLTQTLNAAAYSTSELVRKVILAEEDRRQLQGIRQHLRPHQVCPP